MTFTLHRDPKFYHHASRHEKLRKILWGCLLVVTAIIVACDVTLFFKDRAEKKRNASQQTRVIHKNVPKSKSKLVVTHRPSHQTNEAHRYQTQAKQAVNNTGVSPQTKQKLMAAFDGLAPTQQKHVLKIINSNLSNPAKLAAIKSYVMGN